MGWNDRALVPSEGGLEVGPSGTVGDGNPLFLVGFVIPECPFRFPTIFAPSTFHGPAVGGTRGAGSGPFGDGTPSGPVVFFTGDRITTNKVGAMRD